MTTTLSLPAPPTLIALPLMCWRCHCTEGVEMECSRTAYSYDGLIGDARDPNRNIPLCRPCAEEHHEMWDDRWSDYYGGLL